MDELYRGYRISLKQQQGWTARITHVRGTLMPFACEVVAGEPPGACLERAQRLVDRYIDFLAGQRPGVPEDG